MSPPMDELRISAAAREAPRRDCIIVDGQAWSYAEIADRVRSAIGDLRDRGIETGQPVALAPRVDLDSVLWLFALFELGCPVVLLHPRLTTPERARVLEEARPVWCIDGPVPPHPGRAASFAPIPVPAERTLAVAYTSGTSGRPRGARLSRRAFIASEAAHAANLGWEAGDRWLLCMPPAHVGGLSILTRCLIARRCAVLSPGPFDPRAVIETIERDRVTLLSVVPTMLRRLLQLEDPVWKPGPRLRAILVGGAPFFEALRTLSQQRGVPALATYGCTEACSQVTTQRLDQMGTPGCGEPLRGIELRIDRDSEIQIRGDVLMDGYLGEGTAGSTWTADGWLRTGDAGVVLPDGQLLVRGRMDEIIVTGGENVAPQEVEAWLETVQGVLAACVFSVLHEDWGQQVVAALVADPSRFDPEILRARLRAELAPFKHPRQICLLESLPLNRSGKIDRAEVARRCVGKLGPI
jgi:O-succinylbenzoic acid--CoA ligase